VTARRTVVLDVGETLIDETPLWTRWADWLGVTPFTMFAAIGGMIALGRGHEDAVALLRPGTDYAEQAAAMAAAAARRGTAPGAAPGAPDSHTPRLYPDAEPCLRALAAAGIRVVVGGNQPAAFQRLVERLDLPVYAVTSSGSLGAAKPSPEFYQRIAAVAGADPSECVHVGDRLDNDVVGAREAGMTAVWLRRGPWAHLQRERYGDGGAAAVIDSLAELPGLLAELPGLLAEPGRPRPGPSPG
jgi:HAD superfamily hydrolase (TIGR01509 family)